MEIPQQAGKREAVTQHDIAIVFPGQGSQRSGMGRAFYERFPIARHCYEEASEAVGLDLASLCFDEDDERLAQTEYAQPAILATEIAMLRSAEQELGLHGFCYGGHSLGEYTALVAAGVFPLSDAVRTVRARGRLMQQAVPVGRGRMVAVIAEAIDQELVGKGIEGLNVSIANDNASNQVVLSGLLEDTREAEERLRGLFARKRIRFLPLDVSAPFHSPLMAAIEPRFRAILNGIGERAQAGRARVVTSNVSGDFHAGNLAELVQSLVLQLSSPVKWRSNMEHLATRCSRILEIGPSSPLRGFFKTIGVSVAPVTSLATMEQALVP